MCRSTNPHRTSSNSYRSTFSRNNLIGVIALYPNRWLSLAECRWRAPTCLETVTRLRNHFGGLETLFVSKLRLLDAGPADVLDELLGLSWSENSVQRVKDLLLALSSYPGLGQFTLRERFGKLARCPSIPVQKCADQTQLRHGTRSDWFIADRRRHSNCFVGKVWLFDFDEKQISRLEAVVGQLGFTERRLSKSVREETITSGETLFHQDLSQKLKDKAKYISM